MYLVKFVLQYFKGALSHIQRDTLHEVLRVLVARSFCQYRDVAVLPQQRHHTFTTPNSSATVVHAEHSGQNTVSQPTCLNPHCSDHTVPPTLSQTQCSTQRFCPNRHPTAAKKLCYRCATQKLRQPKSHVFDFIGKFGSGGGTRTPDTRIMIRDGVF